MIRFPFRRAPALLAAFFILKVAVPAAHAFSTVVIDAGHGGHDPGGIPGQRVSEKNMALDVARRLQGDLRRAGYRTVMTRDEDVFVPLPERVAIANEQRDAIFVCIHFNSATRSAANGIETYFYRGDSGRLAASIHANVVGGAPTPNRGIRRRGYYVLRRTAIPSVLVECGFLTNPFEASLAQTPAYRQQLADEIARGVRGEAALPSSYTARQTRASEELLREGESFVNEEPFQTPADRTGTRYLRATAVVKTASTHASSHTHHRTHSHTKSSSRHHSSTAGHHSGGSSKKKTKHKKKSE